MTNFLCSELKTWFLRVVWLCRRQVELNFLRAAITRRQDGFIQHR